MAGSSGCDCGGDIHGLFSDRLQCLRFAAGVDFPLYPLLLAGAGALFTECIFSVLLRLAGANAQYYCLRF
ncbi:hypothetical protein D3C81_2189970 [compost metagenome]